jgi:tetraacyldisaccharide 4'-kinase
MRAPAFWQRSGILPALLTPLGVAYAAGTARRTARPGWRAPVPVICVGNVSVGGTGKTPVALDIAMRLRARGARPHFLTRGYRGSTKGATGVDPARHDADAVGDEALLLAHCAPTWVGADRAATARAAVAAGASVLIMDDGLQNPTLEKTVSLMVIDGAVGFGNGRVLPAGPLREPVAACAARVQAALMIGPDQTGAADVMPPGLPVLHAEMVPGPELDALLGRKILAFAGIGRPEKFFHMLEAAGLELTRRISFPDHHRFTSADLRRLTNNPEIVAVCTQKDFVRIPAAQRAAFTPIGMSLRWQQPGLLDGLLAEACL